MAMFALLLMCVVFTAWTLLTPWRIEKRHARLRAQTFPPAWRTILRRRVPAYRRLPVDLQQRLRGLIQIFLADKAFIGCQGQAIDDEVRVTIAAQACLLQLNRRSDRVPLYPGLHQVLVYPGAFAVDRVRTHADGVVQDTRQALLGESWSQGQVILSWADSLAGAAIPDDGRNVVIHEFAHQLDQETGHANGAPPLPNRRRHARWASVMNREFAALRERTALGLPSLLDAYGASDPAEFFAVACEVFFERPTELAAEHPALYRELSGYFRVHPAQW